MTSMREEDREMLTKALYALSPIVTQYPLGDRSAIKTYAELGIARAEAGLIYARVDIYILIEDELSRVNSDLTLEPERNIVSVATGIVHGMQRLL